MPLKRISNYGLLFSCMQKQTIQGLATQKQHFFKVIKTFTFKRSSTFTGTSSCNDKIHLEHTCTPNRFGYFKPLP